MPLRPLKPTVIGRIASRSVPVHIRYGSLRQVGHLLGPAHPGLPLVLASNRTVMRLHGDDVVAGLTKAGWRVHCLLLPAGESAKTTATIARLHRLWLRRGYDRSTPIVVLGGGALSDAVGFAAATFLRGLPLWLLPTTLVAQVDAAIGGKVGVNLPAGKNLIGCFYHPAGIFVDPSVLSTLPFRDRCAGLAEVVKYGVIADPVLFRRCESRLADWVCGRGEVNDGIIARCVRIKLRIVSQDETDRGMRHVLNFGHTLGHAFERSGDYRRLRHGEAVALGMVGAAVIARQRNLLAASCCDRILALCALLRPERRYRPPLRVPETLRAIRVDKKRRRGRNVWVLPRRIGHVSLVDDVRDDEVVRAIRFVCAWLDRTDGQ
jgi:3-dehydroquinate synthase